MGKKKKKKKLLKELNKYLEDIGIYPLESLDELYIRLHRKQYGVVIGKIELPNGKELVKIEK